jgi:hypothetical protein
LVGIFSKAEMQKQNAKKEGCCVLLRWGLLIELLRKETPIQLTENAGGESGGCAARRRTAKQGVPTKQRTAPIGVV